MQIKLGNKPAAAMCSLVLIGWKPTKGTCIDIRRPIMKKVVYAEKKKKENFLVKTHRDSATKQIVCSHFWYI